LVSYETVRRLLARAEIVFSQPQHKVSSPDPDYPAKKQLVEETRDQGKSFIMPMRSMSVGFLPCEQCGAQSGNR
jgi:hypothetical protein